MHASHKSEHSLKSGDLDPDKVIAALSSWLSPARKSKIDQVIRARDVDVAVVLDGTHDLGNIHAVIRTAEGLGFSEIYIVESQEKFRRANRTSQGTDGWVNIHRFSDPDSCVAALRGAEFRICVTTLEGASPIETLDCSGKIALVFGNEKAGISPGLLAAADARVCLPMVGFAQSYNVSVAAAMALYHLFQRRARPEHREATNAQLRAEYYRRAIEQRVVEGVLKRVEQGP